MSVVSGVGGSPERCLGMRYPAGLHQGGQEVLKARRPRSLGMEGVARPFADHIRLGIVGIVQRQGGP